MILQFADTIEFFHVLACVHPMKLLLNAISLTMWTLNLSVIKRIVSIICLIIRLFIFSKLQFFFSWCVGVFQVFFTAEGKGWGLRTLDELPRGAFVCEYVGEILTNMELYDRTMQTTGNAKHTYPVLLDADWGSEGVLKDEEALCLDATFYGNVARFINHR